MRLTIRILFLNLRYIVFFFPESCGFEIRRLENAGRALWIFCVIGSSRAGWLANKVIGCASHEAIINEPGITLAWTNREVCDEKKM